MGLIYRYLLSRVHALRLAHSDTGEDAGFLLSGVTYIVSVL